MKRPKTAGWFYDFPQPRDYFLTRKNVNAPVIQNWLKFPNFWS